MAMKTDSEKYSRLINAWEWSRKQMQPFRERRRQLVLQQVGNEYGPFGQSRAMPANLFDLAVSIYRRNLASRNPSVDIRAKNPDNDVIANKLELSVNDALRAMDFEKTLDGVVYDALMGLGVMKIGLTEGKTAEWMGILHDAGMPFADHIDFDDFVVDMHARNWENVQFIGNRFEAPYEAVMDSKMYDFDGKPSPHRPRSTNEYGDERLSQLTKNEGGFEDTRAVEMLEMWEIYLPFEQEVCTFLCDDRGSPMGNKCLRRVNWEGPENGPYIHLALNDILGQIIPASPVSGLADLSQAVNGTIRKLVRQQDRQKTVALVAAGAEEDGERLVSANDGEMVRVDRPEATREAKFGGVDQGSVGFLLQLRDLFNYTGGNLDSVGGLSTAADTLGQEEMIKESSSQKIQDMQSKVIRFTKKAVKSIATWLYQDPVSTFKLNEPIAGTSFSMSMDFKPNERDPEKFLDMEFDIVPTSLQDQTPAQRLNTLNSVMGNYLTNLAPHLQQQGMALDVRRYVEHAAELTNTPELMDLITEAPTPEDQQGGGGGEEGMPQETTRNYVNKSVPTGGSRSSRDLAMGQILAGGKGTPEQNEMLRRPSE